MSQTEAIKYVGETVSGETNKRRETIMQREKHLFTDEGGSVTAR